MKDDLADAIIPVFWARDHIPVLQERLLNCERRGHGISAPIDRIFLTGRTTFEEPGYATWLTPRRVIPR